MSWHQCLRYLSFSSPEAYSVIISNTFASCLNMYDRVPTICHGNPCWSKNVQLQIICNNNPTSRFYLIASINKIHHKLNTSLKRCSNIRSLLASNFIKFGPNHFRYWISFAYFPLWTGLRDRTPPMVWRPLLYQLYTDLIHLLFFLNLKLFITFYTCKVLLLSKLIPDKK